MMQVDMQIYLHYGYIIVPEFRLIAIRLTFDRSEVCCFLAEFS